LNRLVRINKYGKFPTSANNANRSRPRDMENSRIRLQEHAWKVDTGGFYEQGSHWSEENRYVFKEGQVIVPESAHEGLITKLKKKARGSITKTIDALRQGYWWPFMNETIENLERSPECQQEYLAREEFDKPPQECEAQFCIKEKNEDKKYSPPTHRHEVLFDDAYSKDDMKEYFMCIWCDRASGERSQGRSLVSRRLIWEKPKRREKKPLDSSKNSQLNSSYHFTEVSKSRSKSISKTPPIRIGKKRRL
jgi:hypothetical protein